MRSEPTRKWVRGELRGETVVDSTQALLVWRTGETVPIYAFPQHEVLAPEKQPVDGLEGYVHVPWDSVDRWLEEEEQVFGHPRDPHHRVDIRRSSRHVRVEANGELLADSERPTLLFETGLPLRFYLPREDVRSAVTGLVAFYNERADITVDGQLEERPQTQWS